MKRSLVLGTVLALFLAAIVSGACVAPAFAITYYDHVSAGGETVIDIAGHPKMQILVFHFDGGDHGVGDAMFLFLWLETPTGYAYVPVAVMTDNPPGAAYAKDVCAGLPAEYYVQLVKRWQFQVFRICKIVLAYWTVPIVTPFVTVPPACLLFKGYDGVLTDITTVMGPLPSGYTLTLVWTGFAAHATFVCPSWHYWGPVGDITTVMFTDMDMYGAK